MSEEASRTRESYDEIAATYSERLFTELAGKPLDRHLLNRLAEDVRGHGLWGHPVSLDFRFLMPQRMVAHLVAAGFLVMERVEREPYPEAEHPSRRCYLLARSPADQ